MPFAAGLYYHLFKGGELDSPPLVLIHGAGGMHLYWPHEVRRMAGRRVFTLDLPGHGRSNQSGGLQSIQDYADQVAVWLGAVGLPKAVFAGHSMGGAVVLALATRYPEHVLGLALVATSARLSVENDILENAKSPTTFYKALEALSQSSFSVTAPPRLVELAYKRMSEIRPSVLHGDLLASNGFDCTELLASIQKPTLVLCGADDRITPVRTSQFLASSIQGAQLVIVPQAGHMVMLEKPAAVAEALRSFLERIPYRLSEVN